MERVILDEVLPDKVMVHWQMQVSANVDYYEILVVNKTYDPVIDGENPKAMQER